MFDCSTKHQNSKHKYLSTADDRSGIGKKRRRSHGGCVPGAVDKIADCGLPCTKHRRGVGDRRGLVGSEEHENHESHNSGPNQRPTDAQHHGHGTTTKTNQNKTSKQTNKQKSNAAANYLFFLFCQTVPLPCTKKSFLGSVPFRVEDY